MVNLQPPAKPVALPYTTFAGVRVGRYTYQGGGAAEPDGPDSVMWRMRYRVLDEDGRPVRGHTVDYRWHVVSPSDLVRELADAGLDGQVGRLDVVRATPAVPDDKARSAPPGHVEDSAVKYAVDQRAE